MSSPNSAGEPKPRVDRNGIISAAIADFDSGALDQLSMRRLAERLGVTPMALYRHVTDKDEILDEILDLALRRDAAPRPAPRARRSWRPWLIECNGRLRGLLMQHPALLDRYLRAPVAVPAALERMEAVLAVLVRAGFNDDEAIQIYASAHTFTLGFTALEVARQRTAATNTGMPVLRGGQRPQISTSTPGFWPLYLGSLPTDQFPHLTRARPDLAGFTSPERFTEGMTHLLSSWSAANA